MSNNVNLILQIVSIIEDNNKTELIIFVGRRRGEGIEILIKEI